MTTEITATALTNSVVALRNGTKTLRQVAADLAGDDLQAAVVRTDVPAENLPVLPKPRTITDEQKAALVALPTVFGKVQPKEKRTLTKPEVKALYDERDALKKIGALLDGRGDDITDLIKHHVDQTALKTEGFDPESATTDAAGHFVLSAPQKPVRVPVEGTGKEFSLEYRRGSEGQVFIDAEVLLDLYEREEITRAQYLALTREARVFDEAKAAAAAVKDPALLTILAKVVRKSKDSAPGTSLFIRKA